MNEFCTDMKVNSFEFKWTIKKFIIHAKEILETESNIVLESPSFLIVDGSNTQWHLKFVPEYCDRLYECGVGVTFYVVWKDLSCMPENRVRIVSFFERDNGKRFEEQCQILLNMHEKSALLCFKDCMEFLETAQINDLYDDLSIVCHVEIIGDIITSNGNYLIPNVIENNLSSDFARLFESRKFTDVTFILCNEKIKAHKAILAARSPVFAAMFEHSMKEQNENEIKIDDIELNEFKGMLQYIYTNEVSDLDDIALNLLYAADKYGLEELKKMCGVSIWREITVENAAEALVYADRHNLKELMELIQEFIDTNIFDVMETVGYKNMEKEHSHLANMILHEALKKFQTNNES